MAEYKKPFDLKAYYNRDAARWAVAWAAYNEALVRAGMPADRAIVAAVQLTVEAMKISADRFKSARRDD